MPDLPRLEQWSDIKVTPFPTPPAGAASLVSKTTAQGAGEMESALGHITAKDIELRRHEQAIESRLSAENVVHQQFATFAQQADDIRLGNWRDEEGHPARTDDLMTHYGRIQGEQRQAGLDSLKNAGPLAQYAFANEFDSLTFSHMQKLHADRDRRKMGDMQGEFDASMKGIIDYAAKGTYSQQVAEQKLQGLFEDIGNRILTPEQQHESRTQNLKAIHLAPYYQQVDNGKGPDLFERIQNGKIKNLSGEELFDLRSKILKDNWEVSAAQSAKYTADKHAFDDNSEKQTVDRIGKIRKNSYNRVDLENDAPTLSKDDYKFLDAGLVVQETHGGEGNRPVHANDKLDIALNPGHWTPERIKSVTSKEGMNPTEGLDLLNEWYKAKQQERNAENDPRHFSKDHRYKMYYNGLERDLGVSPFSVLKPQDQSIVQQAKYDFNSAFQVPYDAGQPLPDFEVEHDRVIARYKNKMSWELEDVSPYTSWPEVKKDYELGKISHERALSLGKILRKKEEAAKLLESEKAKK